PLSTSRPLPFRPLFSPFHEIFERSLPRSGSALNSKFFANPDKNQIGSLGDFFSAATLMQLVHDREKIVEELKHPWSSCDHQQRRKAKEKDGKDQLNSHLSSALFGFLPTPNAKEVGLRAECIRNARTKSICLNQYGRELFHLILP